jgi:hypothetical protein
MFGFINTLCNQLILSKKYSAIADLNNLQFSFAVKNFQSFNMICRKLHMASSICLNATIFQNPEGTLRIHYMFRFLTACIRNVVSSDKCLASYA